MTTEQAFSALFESLADDVADAVVARLAADVPSPAALEDGWRLLTLEEAAAMLTRSTRWVRDKTKTGALPFVKLDGGALAFDPDDVRAFARARRVGGQ